MLINEAGKGIEEILGQVVGGGAVTGALKEQAITTLQSPEVRAELRAALRPALLEAAAVMVDGVAVVLYLFR